MRLGAMTVGVEADLSGLERGFGQAKDKAYKAGEGMALAIGDGLAKAKRHLDGLEKDTEEFLKRHKGKMALAAAAVGAIWAYNNPDDAKRYFNQATDAAGKAAQTIRTSFTNAYGEISSASGDLAGRTKAAMDEIVHSAAQAAGDIGGRFGKAGEEAGKYFTSKFLEGAGDAFLRLGEKAVALGAEFERLSQYSGLGVEQLSRLQSVADQTGLGLESLAGRMQALDQAARGQGDAAKFAREQLAAVGISVKGANGEIKTAEQLWVELAEATRSWSHAGEDAAKRLGILQNVIGSVDKETLELLNEGGASNKARLEEAARLSAIYTDKMAGDMQRIQAERKAEAAEEKAWAQRKAALWAGLGADFKRLGHEVEWGQTNFVDAGKKALDRIWAFGKELWDYYTAYFQGALKFIRDSLASFSPSLVPKSLEDAIQNGPGPRAVIPSLGDRNPDGSPRTPATPPGSVKPPNPLQTPGPAGGGKSGDDLKKYIDSISGAALSEQAAMLGDKYGSQTLAAWKDYTNEINTLNEKLKKFEGENREALEKAGHYWAAYRLGIKLAKAELEATEAHVARWADTMSRIGDLSGDPAAALKGKLAKLQLEQRKAERDINADSLLGEEAKQAALAQIRERSRLEEVKAREASLGDAAKLDDEYWARRVMSLDAQLAHVKKNVSDEHAFTVYAAQQKDKLAKEHLESRMGYEESFGSYLADRLALNYGLYKSAATQTIETWQKMADAIIKGIDGISDALSWTFGQVLGDLLTGKFKSIENYTEQLMAQLKQAFASTITDMAKIAMQRYIVVPIIGQIMGTEGSFGLEGVSGLGTKGGDGASLGSLTKYAGYGKDAYSLYKGGGDWVSGLNNWGYDSLGVGTLTGGYSGSALSAGSSAFSNSMATSGLSGYQALHAADAAAVSSMSTTQGAASTASSVSGGLGSMAAAGGMGAMAGGLGGQLMRPDNPSSSYVGSGVGLGAGALAAYMGAGSWAGPIGMAAALVAAAITAAVTPPTKSYSWAVPNASQPAMFVAGGDILPASYGVVRTTTSGMFGSTDTKHTTIFGLADPKMAAQQEGNWKAANAGLDAFTKAVGASADALKQAKSSFNYPAIPIPEGYEAEVYRNVANAQAEHVLTQLGMIDAIKGVAREGEVYIDTLGRLSVTFAAMENIGVATGFRLEDLARGMDRIAATDYASRLMEAAGGADALAAALGRLATYGYSGQERFERGLIAMGEATGRAIAGIGDMSVTIENFWVKFREATERGLDPANVQAWVIASARMEQWEKSTEQARAQATQAQTQALQQNIAAMQQQISVVQQASQAWRQFSDQMVRLKASLLMDKSLSPLSPLEKMNAAKARLDGLTAEANAKSTAHLADIDQATKDYLTASLEYYGATADYYAIFNATSATIDQLQSLSEMQVSEAAQQIAALNIQIEQNNAQIAALNNINASIGGMVSAVNSMRGTIGTAVQAANAAQRNADVPQWASAAAPADAVAAASPFAWPASAPDESGSAFNAWVSSMGLEIPQYASGGTTKGGWFVAGDDPLNSDSGELLYSPAPVRVFSNRQSRAMLSGGDNSGLESRLDQVVGVLNAQGRVLSDIASILADGGGAGQKIDDLRRVMRGAALERAGQ